MTLRLHERREVVFCSVLCRSSHTYPNVYVPKRCRIRSNPNWKQSIRITKKINHLWVTQKDLFRNWRYPVNFLTPSSNSVHFDTQNIKRGSTREIASWKPNRIKFNNFWWKIRGAILDLNFSSYSVTYIEENGMSDQK